MHGKTNRNKGPPISCACRRQANTRGSKHYRIEKTAREKKALKQNKREIEGRSKALTPPVFQKPAYLLSFFARHAPAFPFTPPALCPPCPQYNTRRANITIERHITSFSSLGAEGRGKKGKGRIHSRCLRMPPPLSTLSACVHAPPRTRLRLLLGLLLVQHLLHDLLLLDQEGAHDAVWVGGCVDARGQEMDGSVDGGVRPNEFSMGRWCGCVRVSERKTNTICMLHSPPAAWAGDSSHVCSG